MISIALIIAIVLLLVFLTLVWPPDSPWSPWWRTNKKVARAACRLAGVSKKDTVYELGSGDGEFILVAAKEFNAKKAAGIEIEHIRHFLSKIRLSLSNRNGIKFIRKNFYDVDLSSATIVYVYLVPRALNKLLPKLKKELKPGTKIVSYKYKMKLKVVRKNKENKLYLYKT